MSFTSGSTTAVFGKPPITDTSGFPYSIVNQPVPLVLSPSLHQTQTLSTSAAVKVCSVRTYQPATECSNRSTVAKHGDILVCPMHNRSQRLSSTNRMLTGFMSRCWAIRMDRMRNAACFVQPMVAQRGNASFIKTSTPARLRWRCIRPNLQRSMLSYGLRGKGHGKTARGKDQAVVFLNQRMVVQLGTN